MDNFKEGKVCFQIGAKQVWWQKQFFLFGFCKKVQYPLDITTGLRQGVWGRYRQRGRYFKAVYLQNGTFYT